MKPQAFVLQRPLVCLALAYALGILLGAGQTGFSPLLPGLGIALSLLAAGFFWPRPLIRTAAFLLAFLFLGAFLGGRVSHPILPAEGSYSIRGTVSGEATPSEDGMRVKARLDHITLTSLDGTSQTLPSAYWTYYPEKGSSLPQDGQQAQFTGQLYHPDGRMNPYGFDFKAYLLQRGIPVGISGARNLILDPQAQAGPSSVWLRIRQGLSARLTAVFGQHGALAKALLLGVRNDLDEGLTLSFRDAGIAHILAVSGLHVGFLVYGLKKVLQFLHLSPGALLAILAALLAAYCRLLDFTPSVVRASILSLLMLSGKTLRRRVDPLTSLAAAFLVILLLRPMDLFNLGFQLSFLAVFGLITLGDGMLACAARQPWFKQWPLAMQKVAAAFFSTWSASLMTLVPIANAFHTFSLIGLVISPLAILLVGWLMAGFIAGLLLSFISLPLACLLAAPVLLLSSLYQGGVELAARLPWAVLRLPALSLPWFLAFYCLLVLLTRYAAPEKRMRRTLAVALSGILLFLPLVKAPQPLRYIQLSAGNADSALIIDGKTTFVIDAGAHGGDLASLLLSEGRAIDRLLITHLHADHAGGLRQLLDQGVTIREILLPFGAEQARLTDDSLLLIDEARAAGIKTTFLARGDVLRSGRVTGEVLWPYAGALYPGMDPNRGSLVVYWDLDGITLLGASDLSKDYARYVFKPAQVLKVPHHGSRKDNTLETLRLSGPQLALITAVDSRAEQYQAAQQTLAGLSARQLVTGQTGAVTLKFSGQTIQVVPYVSGRE